MSSIKTVEYAFPVLASLTDNTLTALTQITAYLPESSKVFKSVVAEVTAIDKITATGGTIASHQVQISVGGSAAASVTNPNVQTHSGENIALFYSADFTSHFVTNWSSGASKTVDCSVLIDQSSGTTLGWADVCVTLRITYEYDETSATHVKTVWIPLDSPVGAVGTSKPGSATATIPDLDTYCPEASKTFRQINIVVQGAMTRTTTTDSTLSVEIDSAGAQTTSSHEGSLQTDMWFKSVFVAQSFSTSSSHSFYMWGSLAAYQHLQCWLVVTYEFDLASTTSLLNSVWLPLDFGTAMGSGSSTYARASVDLWIEEPGTIANTTLAAFIYWGAAFSTTGINARVGTGSFVTYTDVRSAAGAGGCGLMTRNDSAYTLARGRNTIIVDIYATGTAGSGLSGQLLVCYTSDVPADGPHAANKTVFWNVFAVGPLRGASTRSGINSVTLADANVTQSGVSMLVCNFGYQRNVIVAGIIEHVARPFATSVFGTNDGVELGQRILNLDASKTFLRWSDDPQVGRYAFDGSFIWYLDSAINSRRWHLDLMVTYHAIAFAVAGVVSGSAGGTVTLNLHRASDGEQLGTTTRSGDGSYSIPWYDDTEDVYVEAYEDGTHLGRSDNSTAA